MSSRRRHPIEAQRQWHTYSVFLDGGLWTATVMIRDRLCLILGYFATCAEAIELCRRASGTLLAWS